MSEKLILKVCGMRDTKNIVELIKVKPDFIGYIFYEKSSRNIKVIPKINIPNTIQKVGVFVNESKLFITDKIDEFNLDCIQLHGNETTVFCRNLKKILINNENGRIKIIKAFNIHEKFDFEILINYEPYCNYFLFDAFGKNAGGNGITFNWNLLQNYKGQIPFLLSGGINETMSQDIKKIKHPKFIGVDINSGFEIKLALKNINKIKSFYNELQS